MCYNKANWGCDELVKRIPCRVVRSVPFGKGADMSRISRCDVGRSVDRVVDFTEAGFESPCNSSGYTFRAEGVRAGFGESAVGLLVDCLA